MPLPEDMAGAVCIFIQQLWYFMKMFELMKGDLFRACTKWPSVDLTHRKEWIGWSTLLHTEIIRQSRHETDKSYPQMAQSSFSLEAHMELPSAFLEQLAKLPLTFILAVGRATRTTSK